MDATTPTRADRCGRTGSRIAAALVAGCLAIACGSEAVSPPVGPLRVVARLGAATGDPLQRVALASETRSAFAGQLDQTTRVRRVRGLRAEPVVRETLPIPASLRAVGHIIVSGSLIVGDRVARLPSRRVATAGLTSIAVEEAVPAPSALEAAAPASSGGRAASLHLRMLALPDVRTRQIDTAAIDVPAEAVLELALGSPSAALDAGASPVRARVLACRDGQCPVTLLDRPALGAAGWDDYRIDLGVLEPGGWSFRLEWTLASGSLDAFAIPVWSAPLLLVPDEPTTEPIASDGLILISIDTLRAHHLPTYGYPRDTAPFLDRLAAQGTVFEQMRAAATTTGPSHMSMFTGLPPTAHGLTSRTAVLPEGVPTLASRLADAGFTTAAFTENGPLAEARGFGRGFDTYGENRGLALTEVVGYVEQTLAQGRAWLERNHDRPFFLFLHTYQVHAPYTPPDRYAGLFQEPLPQDRPSPARDAYDREIRYTDDQLAQFHAWLVEKGFARRSLLVVTSDHGELFDEHGHSGHVAPPYEGLLSVPLILAGPRVPARRVRDPISHVDLMPTLLAWLGVTAPTRAFGRSHIEQLAAARPAGGDAPATPVFSEAWALPDRQRPPSATVRLGSDKLIRDRGRRGPVYRLYDLAADPYELAPISGPTARGEPLERLLEEHLVRARAVARSLAGDAPPTRDVDPLNSEKLRALGYVE